MPPNLSQILGTAVVPVAYPEPKTFHLPNWGNINDAERIAILRRIVLSYGRDPRIAELAQRILVQAGAQPREYSKQAAAMLRFVQGLYYRNEPGERLQAPDYTLKIGGGDCDDLAILLAALLESVKIPWRFTLSGVDKSKRQIRWVEGEPLIRGIQWSHIYLAVGDKPFSPTSWTFAEPTLKGAPLGWDVVSARSAALPEMNATAGFGSMAPSTPPPNVAIRPDLRDPALDLRDAVKELLLLEDHLAFPDRQCADCIRKHLLKAEALAEEAIQLDTDRKWVGVTANLPSVIREVAKAYEQGNPPYILANGVRAIRKVLVAQLGPAPLNGYGSAAEAGGQVAASLSDKGATSAGLFGVNWQQVGVAVLAGVAVSVTTQVVLDKLGYRRSH